MIYDMSIPDTPANPRRCFLEPLFGRSFIPKGIHFWGGDCQASQQIPDLTDLLVEIALVINTKMFLPSVPLHAMMWSKSGRYDVVLQLGV